MSTVFGFTRAVQPQQSVVELFSQFGGAGGFGGLADKRYNVENGVVFICGTCLENRTSVTGYTSEGRVDLDELEVEGFVLDKNLDVPCINYMTLQLL